MTENMQDASRWAEAQDASATATPREWALGACPESLPIVARFSAAAKALRGPFKKLVQKLELKARRVAVSVSPKAAARYRDTDLHADTALKAARERAAHIRATTRKPRPRAVTAAVDRNTGRVVGMGTPPR